MNFVSTAKICLVWKTEKENITNNFLFCNYDYICKVKISGAANGNLWPPCFPFSIFLALYGKFSPQKLAEIVCGLSPPPLLTLWIYLLWIFVPTMTFQLSWIFVSLAGAPLVWVHLKGLVGSVVTR